MRRVEGFSTESGLPEAREGKMKFLISGNGSGPRVKAVPVGSLTPPLSMPNFSTGGGVTLPVRFIWTRGSTSKKIRLASIAIS